MSEKTQLAKLEDRRSDLMFEIEEKMDKARNEAENFYFDDAEDLLGDAIALMHEAYEVQEEIDPLEAAADEEGST